MSLSERARKVEAVLFSTDKPMLPEEISAILGMEVGEVQEALQELERACEGRAFFLASYNGRYVLELRPEYSWVAERLGRRELSEGALRALAAVLELGEPRPKDVAEILGQGVYRYLKELVEKGYVRVEGRGRNRRLKPTKKVWDRLRVQG